MSSARTETPTEIDPDALSPGLRICLAGIGAVPVSLIGASTFGIVSLSELAMAILLPAMAMLACVLVGSAPARRLAVSALVAGMLATFAYDLFRWSFLIIGWMDRDPIPHIGISLGLEPGWLSGYLWRFVGNGGGIALAFFALGGRSVLAGIAHGLVVCAGLLGVLIFSPHGQQTLFPLAPATVVVAVVGHIIYGACLGYLARRRFQPIKPGSSKKPSEVSSVAA